MTTKLKPHPEFYSRIPMTLVSLEVTSTSEEVLHAHTRATRTGWAQVKTDSVRAKLEPGIKRAQPQRPLLRRLKVPQGGHLGPWTTQTRSRPNPGESTPFTRPPSLPCPSLRGKLRSFENPAEARKAKNRGTGSGGRQAAPGRQNPARSREAEKPQARLASPGSE